MTDNPNNISIVKQQPEEQTEIGLSKSEEQNVDETVFYLPSGFEFAERDITSVSHFSPSQLVLLVGQINSGKSTLYAALFDLFHKKGCGDFIFAGSQTPLGFEKICHDARMKSKREDAHTERTQKEMSYLHLAVRNKNLLTKTKHLLFADVSGETYREAKDRDEDMRALTVFKRASQVFFVIDGALLLNVVERHNVKRDAIKLIKRALEENMISKNQGINLLITKADKVDNFESGDKQIKDFFINEMHAEFPNLFDNIIMVASRSNNPKVPWGTGIDKFLEIALSKKSKNTESLKKEIPMKRQFQRFKYESR